MLDKNKWVKVAAIDIGSNSVRLLIALVDATGKTEPLCTHLATTRLGEGIQAGLLLAEAMERTVKAIQQFIVLIESYDVQQEHILLCATSAVRDALNQHDFLQLVQLRTGFTVKVLSGQEEAFWGYYGVSRNTKLADAYPVVVDVGGGSTEFIWFEKEVLACVSTQVGAVRMTEGRQTDKQILAMLKPVLDKIKNDSQGAIVGIGGTITTLAAMDLKLVQYDGRKVHGHILTRNMVATLLDTCMKAGVKGCRHLPGLPEDRADIIVAGMRIVLLIMSYLKKEDLVVSETGLLYGLARGMGEKVEIKNVIYY